MLRRLLAIFLLIILFMIVWVGAPGQANNQIARKFDEFGDILITDLKARADNFALALQNEPSAKGFVVVYRSRRDLPGISHRYAHRTREYMLMTRGLTDERVVAVDGGEADCLRQEFWIAPPGTTPITRPDAYQRNFVDKDSVRKFDEISWGGEEHDAAVFPGELEAFGAQLRAEPRAYAYVIAYSQNYVNRGSYLEDGKQRRYVQVYRDKAGTTRKVLAQVKRSLQKEFHIAPSRIRLIDGGYRKWGSVEFWIVPRGEYPPTPTPNAYPPGQFRRKK